MKKIEFLAASIPSEIMVMVEWSSSPINLVGMESRNKAIIQFSEKGAGYATHLDKSSPIIRHLDSLTKECVQANYNVGKPFVPIVELAKIALSSYFKECDAIINDISFKTEIDGTFYTASTGSLSFGYDSEMASFYAINNDSLTLVDYQLQLFQFLIKWHFWPNMPEGEQVVYVTDEFNPYK